MFKFVFAAATICLLVAASPAAAHFPWLIVDDEQKPRLFFGEGLGDRDYHLPESITTAEVFHTQPDQPAARLAMQPLEEDGFVGLVASKPIEPEGSLQSAVTYGVYHGSKLCYYTQCFGDDRASHSQASDGGLGLAAILDNNPSSLAVTILWQDKPLAKADISLSNSEGETTYTTTTDKDGKAVIDASKLNPGLNGLFVMHKDKSDSGEIDGAKHKSATHILTATFNHVPSTTSNFEFPRLPDAVSSFGGAVCGQNLYIYGGHIGTAHDHSKENFSRRFSRLALDGTQEWDNLPYETAVQGLALVAHDGSVYRIGGMTANNGPDEDADLHSTTDFSRFDSSAGNWVQMTPLPGERSSHDAVVIGDKLFVVGGWKLAGDSFDATWYDHGLMADLSAPEAVWEELPQPFRRRALAAGALNGKLVAIGGIDEDGEISRQVDIYDPKTETWTEGPELPGEGMNGFGVSAWELAGSLYVNGSDGNLYRLDDGAAQWAICGQLSTPRFFHRLLPGPDGSLLAIGGASMAGHLDQIERLSIPKREQ